MKVKTFTQSLQIFHVTKELCKLDETVNEFLNMPPEKRLISVSDTSTEGEGGTIGIIRVVAYEE